MIRCDRSGSSATRCTRDAIERATTSRATSQPSTALPSASSNSAVGGRWSSATCRNGDGSTASEGARTSAASVSAARCPDSRTNSCRSWTNRPVPRSRPWRAASTAARSAGSGKSPFTRSMPSRNGAHPAATCPPATRRSGGRRMATKKFTEDKDGLVEMAWDPITRIVGSLGIYTKIDFGKGKVAECHSTSSIFRGYSIFMKGKDPRDAHFITSRICGICGDNHATCSVYAQNMAYGVRPPHLGEWIINLGEAAEYMFDHNIFQENLVGVDYCERMVAETNPGVLELANHTEAPGAGEHGYKTIGDIMRSLNPLEGEFYREALQVSRSTREMFCLMEGRHVHPSTLYPGGVGTVATVQLFTDYLTRLMRYVEFMKRVVPMHDDLFDFFYDALPGYEEVGRRRVLLGCWGSLNNPEYCDFTYRNMADWGRKMFVTPGVIVDGKLLTTSLVDINLGIRILLGHSYYEDWEDKEMFVTHDELGNPVDRRHPWNQHTIPRPQKRDFDDKYSWTMSPPWLAGQDHLPLDTGGGPIARLWSTALAGLVDCGYVQSTGHSVKINLPKTMSRPEKTFEWKIPVDKQGQPLSNALERNRARTYFQAYSAGVALYFVEQALAEIRAGRTKTWESFNVPQDANSCGFTEAVRGVLSHHMVIRDGKIANYHPY